MLRSNFGHSTYHGMDVQLEKRFGRGVSFSASYTWSHSLDNVPEQFGSGGGGLQSFRDFRSARGNSNFDQRQRFVSAALWEMPFGKGRRFISHPAPDSESRRDPCS